MNATSGITSSFCFASFAPLREPSRILMTADGVSGLWETVIELARGLRPIGIELILAVMGPALSEGQRRQAASLGNVELRERSFALEWMENPWGDLACAGDWLLDLEAQFHPHAIHLNGFCHGSLPWNTPVLIAMHAGVIARFRAALRQAPPTTSARCRTEIVAGLRGADLVVAHSNTTLESLRALCGPAVELSRMRVIPAAGAAAYRECYRELSEAGKT